MKQQPLLGFSLSDFTYFTNNKLDFLLPKLNRLVPQARAVELSYHYSINEMLNNERLLKKYRYRSFHLPKRGYAAWVKLLNLHQDKLNLQTLIMHPCDVKNWASLKNSAIPVLMENMDNHKKSFRSPKDLQRLFGQHDFNLCLDLNHLKTNGYNRLLWLKKFSSKIRQIHLAGVDRGFYKSSTGVNQMRHCLCLFDPEITDNLKIKRYPVILEGVIPPDRWDLVKQEFDFVRKHLK